MAEWVERYPQMNDCSIAVNVSTKQLTDQTFLAKVDHALSESGLAVDRLEIEITESSVMENPDLAIELLNQIHERGIKLSIDDFGTGYSSLSYLSRLPVDCIKIDRSFVIDIGLNPSTEAIISALLLMSGQLGMFNVAEGIETPEQMSFFEGTNCDLLQGYLFSKPLSASEIELMYADEQPVIHHALKALSRAQQLRLAK